MAEAAVLLGIVAAAAQFTEIGCRLLLRTSTLYSRFQSVPQSFQRMLNQIQLLLQLADRVCRNNVPQLLHQGTLIPSQSQPTRESGPLSWQENVWKICTTQAQDLENVITAMLCETEDSLLRRVWTKVLTLKREEKVCQIMNEIESYKSMLSVWYGQECLDNIHAVRQVLVDTQGAQIANLINEVKAMRSDMKILSKSRIRLDPCGSELRKKQPNQQQCASLQKDSATTMIPAFSFDGTGPLHKPIRSCFIYMLHDWKRMICYRDSRLLLRYSTAIQGECPVPLWSLPSSEIEIRLRIGISWFFVATEIAIILRLWSGKPSVGISLRAETRVSELALDSFFRALYKTRLWETKVHATTPRGWQITSEVPVSTEKQNYLFSVARKMLMRVFQSGAASPFDVDSKGQTLLHLQVERSPAGLENFRTQMIRLLLSIGLKADTLDDKFRTAQQGLLELSRPCIWNLFGTLPGFNSQMNHTLLEWAPGTLPGLSSAIEILDCVYRWPDSISDCGYPQICDIVIRGSVHDLESYISRTSHLKERKNCQSEPLHFAAARNWSQGIEVLLAHGADRYAQDSNKHFPLDIAMRMQNVAAVEILLRGDCTPYLAPKTTYRKTLSSYLLGNGLDGNEELQITVVKTLARHRRQLQASTPYHDLTRNGKDSSGIAEKLFAAGFHNIEGHDIEGMTPLMRACWSDNMSVAAFLLQKGADPSSTHRDAALRAGHFLSFEAERIWGNYRYNRGNDLDPEDEAKLLQSAFDIAGCVDSRCRCSPEGFSPITSTFKADSNEHSFVHWQSFESLQRCLNLSQADLKQQWRCFVRMEIFDRLELTHTCIQHSPTVRTFPEEDRLEIEDEEEELNLQLEVLMEEYDEWEQQLFDGDIVNGVDTFFKKLDQDLRPRGGLFIQSCIWKENDSDILGPGEMYERYWYSSRGDTIYEHHREGVRESYMLRSLFD